MSLEINLAYCEIDKIKELFCEYTSMLGIDLSFQNYDYELNNLPDKYALPYGRLYIATYDNALAGCIALRPLDDKYCEMKRLYVRPQFRGMRIGKALVEKIIADATDMKYAHIVLDTFTTLENSIALYRKFGFYEIKPYCHNPVSDALFFQLDL